MRTLSFFLSCAALLSPLTAGAQSISRAQDALRAEFGPSTRLAVEQDTGAARFVRFDGQSQAFSLSPRSLAPQMARAFFAKHGPAFGLNDPSEQLELLNHTYDNIGGQRVTLTQMHRGVEVFGGMLRVHWDAAGVLRGVNGRVFAHLDVDATPRVPYERAYQTAWKAVAHAAERELGLLAPAITLRSDALMVLRAGVAAGRPGADHLVYRFDLRAGAAWGENIFVDAHSGKIVERHPTVHRALDRELFYQFPNNRIWQEGQPFPGTLSAQQQAIVTGMEDIYMLFSNLSGGTFLSYDGQDATMSALHNPHVSLVGPDYCPNASWGGDLAIFCPEFSDDETVGHEFTHAYTDYTHDLVYFYQSGAINESFSDIFGETMDLINGFGLDAPDAPRTPGECSLYSGILRPAVTVLAPASLAGVIRAGTAAFGTSLENAPPVEGFLVPTVPADGCTAITNAAEVAGNIAIIMRGTCDFNKKALEANTAGAIAAIIVNNQGDEVFNMGASQPALPPVSIPALFIAQTPGTALLNETPGTVEVSMTVANVGTDDSVRWVLGEDGMPIRDMWSPECEGHPGTLAEAADQPTEGLYWCDKTGFDNGGVHFNSGVPNHAFAKLVDGGSFNGETITGIGLTKAANIYWRAMSVYQTALSQFADHADAVEAACQDLIGVDVQSLTANALSGEVITADDCAQVEAAMRATEMRNDVDGLCGYLPVLEQSPPALCGNAVELFADGFDGNTGWVVSRSATTPGFPNRDWQRVSNIPEPRTGMAFFAPDPEGDFFTYCGQGDSDEICTNGIDDDGDTLADWDDPDCNGVEDNTGLLSLVSPPIQLPAGSDGLTLVFDHYVATERDYDGGNLRIRVNGGEWTPVPNSAFIYNGYNSTLFGADDPENSNTNPLAGQMVFSGVDEASLVSQWGQSQIDLTGLASGGDTVEIEFQFGTDVCVGNDGWYIDHVQIVACDNCPDADNPGQQDTDGDGLGDACDACPGDALKTEPGLCGCGVVDSVTDTDYDGVPDCNDLCVDDPEKSVPGACGCGEVDSVCGCGKPDDDTDSDGDGTPDCVDVCPADATITKPSQTGDQDGDGVYDCEDGCPNHVAKTEPGICGCAIPDVDSDGDGAYNCDDECPRDPNKTEEGECGCHKEEGTCEKDAGGTPAGGCAAAGSSGTGGALTLLSAFGLLGLVRRRRARA